MRTPFGPCDGDAAPLALDTHLSGVITRAASFTSSMAKFAAGGFRTVSHQTYQDRFAHCLACSHYDLGLCRLCGCWLDAKVRLPHEACPEGRWGAEE